MPLTRQPLTCTITTYGVLTYRMQYRRGGGEHLNQTRSCQTEDRILKHNRPTSRRPMTALLQYLHMHVVSIGQKSWTPHCQAPRRLSSSSTRFSEFHLRLLGIPITRFCCSDKKLSEWKETSLGPYTAKLLSPGSTLLWPSPHIAPAQSKTSAESLDSDLKKRRHGRWL